MGSKGGNLVWGRVDGAEHHFGDKCVHGEKNFLPRNLTQRNRLQSGGYLVFYPAETVGRNAGFQVDAQGSGGVRESCRQTNRLQRAQCDLPRVIMPSQGQSKLGQRPPHLFSFLAQLERFSAGEKPGVGAVDLGIVFIFPVTIKDRQHREFVREEDMLEAASYPGLSARCVMNHSSIDRSLQSLRIAERADREDRGSQVKNPDQLTDARRGGNHGVNADLDARPHRLRARVGTEMFPREP